MTVGNMLFAEVCLCACSQLQRSPYQKQKFCVEMHVVHSFHHYIGLCLVSVLVNIRGHRGQWTVCSHTKAFS